MAYSVDSRHGTSDEYHNPYCETCEEARGRNVKVHCFCKNCNQYLCTECHIVHGKLKATKGHVIQTGEDMPRSMAEKPPSYDACDDHPKLTKDQFCSTHGVLLCSACCSSSHQRCDTRSVEEARKSVAVSDVDVLYDVVKNYKEQLLKVLSIVDKHDGNIKDQKKTMLKDAQTAYEKILAELNKGLQNTKTSIKAEFDIQESVVSQSKEDINAQIVRVDTELSDIDKLKGKAVDAKSFLRLQEVVTNTRESTVSFEGMKRSVRLESLTFMPSKDVQKLLSTGITFGSVIKGKVNFASEITVPDIKFSIYMQTASCPVGSIQLPGKHGTTKLASEVASRSNVRATKAGTYNIKMADDKYDCFIAGIAVTSSGKRLFADKNNFKVKMFSQDMTFLSSVSLRGSPWDITMINDREAVVTTGDGNELVFLTVSDRELSITETIKLPYKVLGIAKAKDNFVVASASSMMKIDRRGKECWSVTNGGQGQRLFDNARYVCCYSDGRSVAVTDPESTG